MSTADQTHSSRLHGAALGAAEDKVFEPVLDRLADPEVTPEERAEVAGMLARQAFADLGPDADFEAIGRQLIAAGRVLGAGVIDGDQLLAAVQAGYERGKGSLEGYDPSGCAPGNGPAIVSHRAR